VEAAFRTDVTEFGWGIRAVIATLSPVTIFPESDYPFQALTGQIIAAFYEVHRTLGHGFLEPVYRRALTVELLYQGMTVEQEVPFEVVHRGVIVGNYRADQIVESSILLEVKAGSLLDPAAPAQLLNYLKVSGLSVGLILHFGPRPSVKRIIASRGQIENL
jgi:GxxExxY protein